MLLIRGGRVAAAIVVGNSIIIVVGLSITIDVGIIAIVGSVMMTIVTG